MIDTSERSTITAIEPQVKHRDRVSVYVDGEWVLGVHAEVAAAVGLRVGQVITVAELQALARREELRRAKESALRLLGYRARSEAELRLRLVQKGYDEDVVRDAVASLKSSGLINDAEFTESWVRSRTGSRPIGPRRLAAELRQKGVDREVIEDALRTLDQDTEMDLALAVGRRKVEQLRKEDIRTARRKLAAALARRGFSLDVCNRALDILLETETSEDE